MCIGTMTSEWGGLLKAENGSLRDPTRGGQLGPAASTGQKITYGTRILGKQLLLIFYIFVIMITEGSSMAKHTDIVILLVKEAVSPKIYCPASGRGALRKYSFCLKAQHCGLV